jgi:hypothetical protein
MIDIFLCKIGLHKWTDQHRSEYRNTDPKDWKEPTWIRQRECLRCGKIERFVLYGIYD